MEVFVSKAEQGDLIAHFNFVSLNAQNLLIVFSDHSVTNLGGNIVTAHAFKAIPSSH
jgi:hypothetical protein